MLKYQIVPVTQFMQNCTLLWCDETHEAALIDPGGEAPRLLQAVQELGLTLTGIWLTHGHLDHVGAADELRQATGCPITAPPLRCKCSGSKSARLMKPTAPAA